LALSLELDSVQNVRSVLSFGDKYLSYSASLGAQKLENGVAPFDLVAADTFAFTRRGAASATWCAAARRSGP
jgi:hypothetical protein